MRYRWARYALAVAAVGAALALRTVLKTLITSDVPFLLLFAAVMAAAAYGGLGPGLLATVLGGIAGYGLFQSPVEGSGSTQTELVLFLLEGGLLSILAARLHQAIRQAAAAERANLDLEQRILEISDDERRRIGHDLHDGLGQQLTGIALLSKALQQRLSAVQPDDAQAVERIASLVNQSIAWTRDLARGLAPMSLESADPAAAFEEATANSAHLLGIECSFHAEGELPRIEEHAAIHLVRIIQEAITNSVKHGKARHVRVMLSTDSRNLSLDIRDDGIGMSAKTLAKPGLGLRIMNYRARMIGAKIEFGRSNPGGGALVRCIVPLSRLSSESHLDVLKS